MSPRTGELQAPTSQVRREICCKVSQICQLLAQVYIMPIEQDGQEGLGGACIGDDLLGEKHFAMIICVWHTGAPVLLLLPLEEEDESVYWPAVPGNQDPLHQSTQTVATVPLLAYLSSAMLALSNEKSSSTCT